MLEVGTIFADRFEVLERLGEGGMAELYRVAQLSVHGRPRALKVMKQGLGADGDGEALFEREVEILASIEHRNVVEIIDRGIDPRTRRPWLVMELLRGVDLEALIARRGRLGMHETLVVLGQIADALHAVHERGVVHRDLKPANVFVRDPLDALQIKLLDFGIARRIDGTKSRALGTPYIAAPEQLDGRELTARTDVWAFGLLAFELLTGRAYWTTLEPPAVLLEIVDAARPLPAASARAAERGVVFPTAFDDWFAHCVNRDPERRFTNVLAALAALRAVSSGAQPETTRRTTVEDLALEDAVRQLVRAAQPKRLAPRVREVLAQLDRLTSEPGRLPRLSVARALRQLATLEAAPESDAAHGVRQRLGDALAELGPRLDTQRAQLETRLLETASASLAVRVEPGTGAAIDARWWAAYVSWAQRCLSLWSDDVTRWLDASVHDAWSSAGPHARAPFSVELQPAPGGDRALPSGALPAADGVADTGEAGRLVLLAAIATRMREALDAHCGALAAWARQNLSDALLLARHRVSGHERCDAAALADRVEAAWCGGR